MKSLVRNIASRLCQLAYGAYVWFLFCSLLIICGVIVLLLHRPHINRRIVRLAARALLKLCGVRFSATGIERLPREPHVLLVNHTSFVDGIVLTALLPPCPGYAFVARQEFRIQSIFCPVLRSIGTLVLTPPKIHNRRWNVRRMANALKQGQRLIIFPEGGFVPDPGIRTFHSGAFDAASLAGVPLVVAALRGTRQALRPRSWLPRRTEVSLTVGSTRMPTRNADIGDSWSQSLLREAVRNEMEMLSSETATLTSAPRLR